jgi:hypothetical protein
MSDLDLKVAKLRGGASHALADHAGVHPATKAIPDDKLTSGDIMHARNVLDHGDNIARGSGTASKRFVGQVAPTHGSMAHVQDGVLMQSVSKTDVARAPDASGDSPLEPDYRHGLSPKQRNVPIKPGMRSRTSPGLTNDSHFALGAVVLGEAVLSGATALPKSSK